MICSFISIFPVLYGLARHTQGGVTAATASWSCHGLVRVHWCTGTNLSGVDLSEGHAEALYVSNL